MIYHDFSIFTHEKMNYLFVVMSVFPTEHSTERSHVTLEVNMCDVSFDEEVKVQFDCNLNGLDEIIVF